MNVAITGACGLLGAHLSAALSNRHRVIGFDRHPWWGTRRIALHQGDLGDAAARSAFLTDAAPDVLIHCAALANVDECEKKPVDAYFINGAITGLLARAIPRHCQMVYITTDGIFRGDASMRQETDLPCPRTVYGRSKLHGEWETQLATPSHLIIRTNFFGWSAGRKNTAAEWLYRALANEEPITLFDDFWFTPIYVLDLVERILALIAGNHSGIFHVAGRDRVSKYDFGMKLARAGDLSTARMSRGSIGNAALTAPRPRDMSLSSEKTASVLGCEAPDCDSGLSRFLADRKRTLEDRVGSVCLNNVSTLT
jgi:dTDP-4-dehydrorhamnose reductase